MKVGFIGLGKMGNQMVTRLLDAGQEVVISDINKSAVASLAERGAIAATDEADLVQKLGDHAVIWLMIPSQVVDDEVTKLLELVPEGAILIDGGNSDFRHSIERGKQALARGVHFVDVGTSGGVLGYKNGFSMMVGGNEAAVASLTPIFEALAMKDGWHRLGDTGAGHYVKMVHNAIEYGLMQSYAEGYRMLREGPIGGIDLVAAGEVWRHGSIVGSLLNDLTVEVLRENPELSGIDGVVAENGETRWTLEVASEMNIPLPAIEAAFGVRLASQEGSTNFATKLLAAQRNKFGGHAINQRQES